MRPRRGPKVDLRAMSGFGELGHDGAGFLVFLAGLGRPEHGKYEHGEHGRSCGGTNCNRQAYAPKSVAKRHDRRFPIKPAFHANNISAR